MSDQDSSHIALIVVFSIFIGLYLLVLIILHCFGKINNIIFPAPTPMYEEKYFEDKLYFANLYNQDGNLGKTKINVVNGKPTEYSLNLEKVRSLPYVYIKNKYSETNLYIIYFHGNAEDMWAAAQFMEYLMKMINANIFVIEYPGYGIYRNVKPTSTLIEQDALVYYDEIKRSSNCKMNKSISLEDQSARDLHFIWQVKEIQEDQQQCQLINQLDISQVIFAMVVDAFSTYCVACLISSEIQKGLLIHGLDDPLILSHHSQEIYQNLPVSIQQKSNLNLRPRMTHNEYDIDEDIACPILEGFTDLKQKKFS